MTTATARDIGLELRKLIADLEPTRWRDEKAAQMRAKFDELQSEISDALDEWSADEAFETVRQRLAEIHEVVDGLPNASDLRESWMEFRTQIHPAYEALAEALKACHVELPAVRPTNYARSAFHVGGAIVALLFVEFTPWDVVVLVPIAAAVFFWFLEISRRFIAPVNDFLMSTLAIIAHPHERYRVNSSTWYATALSAVALTGSAVGAAAAVTVLGIGDPIAALVGRRFGRTKLINNRSLEGTLAFALSGFVCTMAVLGTWHADLSVSTQLAVAGAASVGGALAELFSRRIDDNFSIPLVAGILAWAVTVVFAA